MIFVMSDALSFKVNALNEQLGLKEPPFNPLELEQELDGILRQLHTQLTRPELRLELRNRARKLGRQS